MGALIFVLVLVVLVVLGLLVASSRDEWQLEENEKSVLEIEKEKTRRISRTRILHVNLWNYLAWELVHSLKKT